MRNQNTVYLGLFLMVLGLYAYQVKKPAPSETEHVAVAEVKKQEHPSVSHAISEIFEQVRAEEIFTSKIDGLSLLPDHDPIQKFFSISRHGDEVYSSGESAIADNWNAVLDWLGDLIVQHPCLQVEIDAYADDSDLKEKTRAERGAGMIALSHSRAEWAKDLLIRKHGKAIEKQLSDVKGLGPRARGKRVEFQLHCDEVRSFQ